MYCVFIALESKLLDDNELLQSFVYTHMYAHEDNAKIH